MFVTVKVFDKTLRGKAVKLKGVLIDGYYIISNVQDYEIEFIGVDQASLKLSLHSFESGDISMKILEAQEQDDPAEVQTDGGKHRPGLRRVKGSRRDRSPAQIRREIREVEKYLRQNPGPVRLAAILEYMNEVGHNHWNNNNASGFVKHAIRTGGNVKQIKKGFYAYGRAVKS